MEVWFLILILVFFKFIIFFFKWFLRFFIGKFLDFDKEVFFCLYIGDWIRGFGMFF